MFVYKKYSVIINKNKDTTIGIFKDNLDDMTKKGHSFGGETVIYNSDHKSKYFSGEYKNDRFVVRQTSSGTDDFYYRILPRHEITFDYVDNNTTRVNVKSKCNVALVMSLLFLLIAVVIFGGLYSAVAIGEIGAKLLLLSLIPFAMLIVTLLLSAHSINDTKATLEYIFNKN